MGSCLGHSWQCNDCKRIRTDKEYMTCVACVVKLRVELEQVKKKNELQYETIHSRDLQLATEGALHEQQLTQLRTENETLKKEREKSEWWVDNLADHAVRSEDEEIRLGDENDQLRAELERVKKEYEVLSDNYDLKICHQKDNTQLRTENEALKKERDELHHLWCTATNNAIRLAKDKTQNILEITRLRTQRDKAVDKIGYAISCYESINTDIIEYLDGLITRDEFLEVHSELIGIFNDLKIFLAEVKEPTHKPEEKEDV